MTAIFLKLSKLKSLFLIPFPPFQSDGWVIWSKSQKRWGSAPKIRNSNYRLFWDEVGGGPDFHAIPNKKWLKYTYSIELMIYWWDIGNIWYIYGWYMIDIVPMYLWHMWFSYCLRKGQRECNHQKCLNIKLSPILVREVGHQISVSSKFKKVYIIPPGRQGFGT